MLKSFKYFGIILIVFFLLFSLSTMSLAASDIDMNLEDNSTADNEIVIEENGTYSEEETENTTETISTDDTDSSLETTVSATSVSATTDDGLSFTNILNILLITVGVVLILLAIAILIRLK